MAAWSENWIDLWITKKCHVSCTLDCLVLDSNMLQYIRSLTWSANPVAEELAPGGKISLLTIPWSHFQTYFCYILTMPLPQTTHCSPASASGIYRQSQTLGQVSIARLQDLLFCLVSMWFVSGKRHL